MAIAHSRAVANLNGSAGLLNPDAANRRGPALSLETKPGRLTRSSQCSRQMSLEPAVKATVRPVVSSVVPHQLCVVKAIFDGVTRSTAS